MNTATPKRESQHYVTLMGIRQALWTRVLTALLGGLMGGSFGGCSDIGGGLHQPAQRNTRHHDHAPALQRTSQPLGSTHTPDATDTSDAQAAFKSPVSNTGAFTQTIPIDIPHGIGGLQPELSLTYSSQGGPSMVGVGWNLSMPAISLNVTDGFRPRHLHADLARFDPDTWVERYIGHHGRIVVSKDREEFETATRSFAFSPNNDMRIAPIASDASGSLLYQNGEVAAWEVRSTEGTAYRFGTRAQSRLVANAGATNERPAMWFLDRVEDVHGNQMRYYYQEHAHGDTSWRQKLPSAIEYGIPASAPGMRERLVVGFEFIDSPWRRSAYNGGTRHDLAWLIDTICIYSDAHVQSDGDSWAIMQNNPNAGEVTPIGDGTTVIQPDFIAATSSYCYLLTYDFELQDPQQRSYTGRPLLLKVHREASDGSALPGWQMTYNDQGLDWRDTYRDSLAGSPVARMLNHPLGYTTHSTRQRMTDLNGDGRLDRLVSSTDGADMLTAMGTRDDAFSFSFGPVSSHPNPLERDAFPMCLEHDTIATQETLGADCYHTFETTAAWVECGQTVNWSDTSNLSTLASATSSGLGYARPLTQAPADPYMDQNLSTLGGRGQDFTAITLEPTGAFQHLQSTIRSPAPHLVNANKDRFDELTQFGAEVYTKGKRAQFDWRASDCRDWGNAVGLDHCYDVGSGAHLGTLGNDLKCLENAGARWFTSINDGGTGHPSPVQDHSSRLWDMMDINDDGYQDWIYAAPLIVRDEDSNVRDFDRGENDWFVALGSESGWEPVERWTMPSRLGGNLSTPGVDYVHNTQHLNTTVTHHFLDDDFYSHNGGIGITFAVRTVPTPALIKPSVSFDLGNGVTSSTLACAAANMPTAACGAASGAVNMAQSQGHEAMGTLSMMTGAPPSPSVGLGIRVNQHGVHLESVYVPVFGDLLSYNVEESALDTYQYQGLADLDGDGRVDFVSTRFDDGTKDDPEHTELNAPNTWLFYRNTGSGFEEPVVWHMPPDAPNGGVNLFEVPPSYLGVYGVFRSAMHIDYQKRWTDKEITWQDGTRYLRYSETIQRASLADLNSDGLLDLVGQDFRVHGTGPQTQHHLSVHYNLGNQFSDATHLEVPNFELDNRVSPGNTAGVSIYPSMMVGGHINADTSVSRQVQGLFDVNQDGLLDVTFIPPTQTVDGYSSYFGEQNGTDGVPESFISPAQLNAPIKVALNTGRGFAPPVTWVDASAFALSGGVHDMRTSTPKSVPFTALGDYDHDGLVELAVRDPSRALLYDMEWDIPVAYSLYELHRPNVDVLDTLTTPFGGQMEVEYGIEWDEGPEMPTPIWVTRAITTRDIDPTRSDITHHYTYEHGSYDRPWKSFRGFERIYTYADDQGGWTMTRYLQERGFEHLPYCTEVREHVTGSPTSNLLTDQVALRRMAWSTTPSGLVRSGYTRALVYGDSTRLTLQPPPELAPPGHDDVEVFDGIDPYATASPSEPLTTDAAEADDTDYGPTAGDPNRPNLYETFERHHGFPHVVPSLNGAFNDLDSSVSYQSGTDGSLSGSPLWSDCTAQGLTMSGTVVVGCPDLEPDLAIEPSCGDDDEPGTLRRQTFHIYQDFASHPDLLNTRLVENHTFTYDTLGLSARHTAESFTYDNYGNPTT